MSGIHPPVEASLASAATLEDDELAQHFAATGLSIRQRARSLGEAHDWLSLIRCLGGPVFARHRRLPVWIWETPEWGTPKELNLKVRSVGSLETYAAVAASFAATGWGNEHWAWFNREWWRPVSFHFWRYPDGAAGILLGNIESGLTGHSQWCVHGTLAGAARFASPRVLAGTPPVKCAPDGPVIRIGLASHKSCVLTVERPC